MDARVRERLFAASHQDPAVLETFLAQRKSWQQALAAELDGAVLITPTVAHTAPELAPLMQDDDLFAQTNLATLRLTMPGSLLDMPGIALPTGKDANGLYTSLLFSLPAGEDRRLLHAASTVAGTFTADHSVCA
ncbi:amidase family protein [Pantoea ananatis]|nr:amidase family protein [Pantoea ananatis]